ncbi:MAG: TetR/AcrR family transcriptional regulator [Dictyoglomi bacterium]|nr:TetR/AcrR family transcriptional regulator [Dictyoglomota bacterium]
MRGRQSYREEIRDSIAETVLKLMEHKRFDDIKIEEIMQLAGFTKGTFYQYFDRKESLWQYLVDSALEKFRMMLTKSQETASDAEEALDTLIASIIEEKNRSLQLWRIFAQAMTNEPMLRRRIIDRLFAFIFMFGGRASYESAMVLLGTFMCIWVEDRELDREELKKILHNAVFYA